MAHLKEQLPKVKVKDRKKIVCNLPSQPYAWMGDKDRIHLILPYKKIMYSDLIMLVDRCANNIILL